MKKGLRYDVFARDEFTCQYCGRRPPEVVLEVDHIIPISKGGDDDKANLITSCRDCNRGKGKKTTGGYIAESLTIQIEERKEKIMQLKKFYEYQAKQREQLDTDIDEIEVYFYKSYNTKKQSWSFTETGRRSIRNFLSHFTKYDIYEAIDIALQKPKEVNDAFNYLCGIMWNWIRNGKGSTAYRKH